MWIDSNHDGISSPHELQSLEAGNVGWMAVAFETVNRRDRWGNLFRLMSRFGVEGDRPRLFYDVSFASVP
ncbi:MAG TPA: hypothetical protein VF266_25310 [Thermoanaerobaculia bacterium]